MADYIIKERRFFAKGRTYVIKDHYSNDFSRLEQPKQSVGVVLNENNEVLLVSRDGESWILPGGNIERDEVAEQALVREVYEEAAVAIDPKSIEPFFYTITYEQKDDELVYQSTKLRFLARAFRIDKFEKDPNGNIEFNKFVPIDDLDKTLSWEGTNEIIKAKLKELYPTA